MKKITLMLDDPGQRMLDLLCRALGQPAREVVKYGLSCAIVTVRKELEAMGVRPDNQDGARDQGGEAETTSEGAATSAAPAQA